MTLPAASHVWLDGQLRPAAGPHLSVYDRGFQLGDGVFETLRARRGVAIELDGHLTRLHHSLEGLSIELPFSDEAVRAGVTELLAAEGWDGVEPPGDAVVRITISRGFNPTRGLSPRYRGTASVAIQVWPFTPPPDDVVGKGERLVTSAIRRDAASPIASIKMTSRADLVWAHMEAERAGADDAIFLTTDGRIAEATTSNILLIRGNICATPRLGTGLLAGTTRAWLVDHGNSAGLRVEERDLHPEDIFEADEAALCSSVAGVIPFVSLDNRTIGSGIPGPHTIALRAARERWIDNISREGAAIRLAASNRSAGPAGA